MSGPVCRGRSSRTELRSVTIPGRNGVPLWRWMEDAYGERQTGSDGVQKRSTPVEMRFSPFLSRRVLVTYSLMGPGGPGIMEERRGEQGGQ
jgi:hypothetical protein